MTATNRHINATPATGWRGLLAGLLIGAGVVFAAATGHAQMAAGEVQAPPAPEGPQLPLEYTNVAIEVRMVEVLYDRSKDLGIDWLFEADEKAGQNAGTIGDPGDVNAVEGSVQSVRSRFGLFAGDGPDISGGFRLGASFGFADVGTISAVIDALTANSSGRVLSEPLIVTTHNTPASIHTGIRLPYNNVQISGNRDVIVTQWTDTGVSLKVKPFVMPSRNMIQLEVEPAVSFVTRFVEVPTSLGNFSQPAFSERSAKTIVKVHNGHSFVLAGLFQTEYREQNRRVPGLGSIPLVGLAFRSTRIDDYKTELLIFIRPLILGPYDLFEAERNMAGIYGTDPEGMNSVFALSE